MFAGYTKASEFAASTNRGDDDDDEDDDELDVDLNLVSNFLESFSSQEVCKTVCL